ncbi:MAG: stress response translation initiation inhibitor YciH [Candidatus Micrarchaeota archaeon]|nr:stress response translation initiation inhibitor YciH [Candidatus Micrarchaeota archaeon]
MPEICKKCGMIKDLCVCEILDKEEATKIRVYTIKAKFQKLVTIVEGIDRKNIDDTAKELKHALACGGSAKGGQIVLQGDHKKKMKSVLVKMGYTSESIQVE